MNNPYYGNQPHTGGQPPLANPNGSNPFYGESEQQHQGDIAPPPFQQQYIQQAPDGNMTMTTPTNIVLEPTEVEARASECQDVLFAILFWMSIAANMMGMIYFFQKANCDGVHCPKVKIEPFNAKLIGAGIATGLLFTASWLFIILHCASAIIKASLVISPVICIVGALIMFAKGLVIPGVFLLIIALIQALYAWFVWKRIPFATVCLQIATSTFRKFKAPLVVNFLMVIIGIAIAIVDVFAWRAINIFINNLEEQNKSSDPGDDTKKYGALYGVMVFLWLWGVLWHCMVAMNVAHTTACGTMGSWFFGQETSGVTFGSFKRAVTTSFGSICFGSLITSFIRALQVMVRAAQSQQKSQDAGAVVLVCLACIECLIDILGDIIEYFNDYAYVNVAVYGTSYIQSAKNTLALFRSTGMKAIINDDLTHIPLVYGWIIGDAVMVLVMTAITFLMEQKNGDEEERATERALLYASMGIAVLFGSFIYYGTVSVITSYIKALFVCWAENPAEFSLNRPEECERMVIAARKAGHNTDFCRIGTF